MLLLLAAATPSLLVGCGPARAELRVRMGMFDGLAAAFANDDTLSERQEAGLKNKLQPQKITWVGPEPEGPAALFSKQRIDEQTAMPGQSIQDLAELAGVPIRYSCYKGTCHLCDVKIDGITTPACMAKLGKADVTIEYMESSEAEAYAKEALKAERDARRAAKAGAAPAPADAEDVVGTVTSTSPAKLASAFGELPKLEMPNPFASRSQPQSTQRAGAPADEPADEPSDEASRPESNLELVRRLRMEEQIKKENGGKSGGGGWFS